jgi:hypothetical protein
MIVTLARKLLIALWRFVTLAISFFRGESWCGG